MPNYVSITPRLAKDTGDAGPTSSEVPESKRRRVGVSIACNVCRRKKIRCDGRRPVCSACENTPSDCQYRDDSGVSEESQSIVLEVIRLLNALPDHKVLDKVRTLKREIDAPAILSSLRDKNVAQPPLDPSAEMTVMSDASHSLELGLQYPTSILGVETLQEATYQQLVQVRRRSSGTDLMQVIDASAILSSLRGTDTAQQPLDPSPEATVMSDASQSLELGPQYPNAYPTTPILGLETLQEATYQQLVQAKTRNPGTDLTQVITKSEEGHSQPLCDSRLTQLNISDWTNVTIDNDYAARAISLYLETDHPLLGFFDPNSFVSNLTMGETDYCSPMLVNALLYWACQLNSSQDPHSGSLALSFCSEAESLWEIQRNHDSLLNLAAAQFLTLGYLGQGRDHAVLTYLNEASQMAVRMGLFGGENDKQQEIDSMLEPAKSAHLYAAWGSFNWITHMSLFYRQPGLHCPQAPPQLPIPGSQINGDREPDNPGTLQVDSNPKYMGGVFPYICQFWSILHELALMYRHKGPLAGDVRTLYFAEFKFRELLAWSNRLPPSLSRNDRSPHYVQILHIWLHAAILDLFRFSMSSDMKNQHLKTFTSAYSTPENVCVASARQLKQLIINYRLNFDSSSYTILWHTALTYLANAILHHPKEENWFFYFLLCVYGYERLRPCWRVTQAISTALLSMALRKRDITSPTARQLLHDINGYRGYQLPGEVRAPFMMDLELATSDPESATVERIAQEFDQNLLLQQYTNIFDG